MIERAQRVIVVADGSKVGRAMLARLATLDEVDVLVTDSGANEGELDRIRRRGVEVHVVPTVTGP